MCVSPNECNHIEIKLSAYLYIVTFIFNEDGFMHIEYIAIAALYTVDKLSPRYNLEFQP